MGTYYGVRKVIEHGQRIGFAPERQPSVTEGWVLVGIMNNGVWAIAPDLTRESEYQAFHQSYAQGTWSRMDLYEVPKEKIKDCPDEGRVSVRELEQLFEVKNSSN